MAKDYYTVIGVPRGASQEEVKQAYRRLAREYHPDVRKDDPQANERFKEINEAYYVLGDPDRRSQYDRFGQVGDMPARDFGRDFGDLFSPFDDLFDMFFGRGARTTARPQQDQAIGGAHLRHDLEISLEEAAHGTEKAITFSRLDTCTVCFGTGRERDSAPETCPTCGGPRGDLYVVVHVRPHPVFAREGSDLYCEVPISMVQAALGDEISVPGIDDPTTMAIPPGTQPGTRLRPALRLPGPRPAIWR